MNLRFIDDNLAPLFLTMATLTGAACWFGTTLPNAPAPAPAPAENWQLPQVAEHNYPKLVTAIKSRNLWGALATDPVKEPEWRVVGIAAAGAERFVLLSVDGKPVATLRVGDSLPDETKIVQIDNDRFFVQAKNKKKIVFGLYKNEQAQ